MEVVLTVVHVFLAVGLIALILLQHGRGADAGAAFGSGASSTVFGSRGSANFMTRTTSGFAIAFFLTSIALGYFATQSAKPKGLMEQMPVPESVQSVPGLPAQDEELPTIGADSLPAISGDGTLPQIEEAGILPAVNSVETDTAAPAEPTGGIAEPLPADSASPVVEVGAAAPVAEGQVAAEVDVPVPSTAN